MLTQRQKDDIAGYCTLLIGIDYESLFVKDKKHDVVMCRSLISYVFSINRCTQQAICDFFRGAVGNHSSIHHQVKIIETLPRREKKMIEFRLLAIEFASRIVAKDYEGENMLTALSSYVNNKVEPLKQVK